MFHREECGYGCTLQRTTPNKAAGGTMLPVKDLWRDYSPASCIIAGWCFTALRVWFYVGAFVGPEYFFLLQPSGILRPLFEFFDASDCSSSKL
jgi:hypothetical protein